MKHRKNMNWANAVKNSITSNIQIVENFGAFRNWKIFDALNSLQFFDASRINIFWRNVWSIFWKSKKNKMWIKIVNLTMYYNYPNIIESIIVLNLSTWNRRVNRSDSVRYSLGNRTSLGIKTNKSKLYLCSTSALSLTQSVNHDIVCAEKVYYTAIKTNLIPH